MPDEFTFVVAKAALVIASSTGVVLFLAWVAAKKCFPEARDVEVRKAASQAALQAIEHPEIGLAVAPSRSLRNLGRRFLLLLGRHPLSRARSPQRVDASPEIMQSLSVRHRISAGQPAR